MYVCVSMCVCVRVCVCVCACAICCSERVHKSSAEFNTTMK